MVLISNTGPWHLKIKIFGLYSHGREDWKLGLDLKNYPKDLSTQIIMFLSQKVCYVARIE